MYQNQVEGIASGLPAQLFDLLGFPLIGGTTASFFPFRPFSSAFSTLSPSSKSESHLSQKPYFRIFPCITLKFKVAVIGSTTRRCKILSMIAMS